MAKKGKGKREQIEPNRGDKRSARRGESGEFREQDDAGRSQSRDLEESAKRKTSQPGYGDRRDRE